MTRNRERRSFTVAAKSSGHQGFVSIPAKAPRVQHATVRKPLAADPWALPSDPAPAAAPAAPVDAEPRRILPNLIAWEAPEPEPEPEIASEPALPRVRRVVPQGGVDAAPRRRGRPRKHPLPIETFAPVPVTVEPVPVLVTPRPVSASAKPAPLQRKERPQSETLRLGERWKRRLPRSCW